MANEIQERSRLGEQERYWQRRLTSELPALDACLDNVRPLAKAFHREELNIAFSEPATARIYDLCRGLDKSLLVLLLTAIKALWVRYGAEQRLAIGSATVVSRQGEAAFFENAVPILTDLSGKPSVAECLERTANAVREVRQNNSLPFAKIVSLRGHNIMSPRSPTFQTMLLSFDLADRWVPPGAIPSLDYIADYATACDAVFNLSQDGRRLSIHCQYDCQLFRQATIKRYLSHLRILIEGMIEFPEARLFDIPIMEGEEETQVLVDWNQTDISIPSGRSFVQLFEEQVAEHPDSIGAQFGERQLSYDQLNRSANRVARALRAAGIGPEDLVALLDERNLDLLVAMLGVWKTGAAYVPLDPRNPPTRIAAVLEVSRAPVVLVGRTLIPLLDEAQSVLGNTFKPRVMVAEGVLGPPASDENLEIWTDPSCLAYTIFTSGSTGVPKGAMVEQRGMVNHLFAKIRDLKLCKNDIVAETASQCFDISVWQFMAPLLVGARVDVAEDDVAYDPVLLLEFVAQSQATVLQIVPTVLHAALGEGPSDTPPLNHLRWMISTGEALPHELCQRWLRRYPEIPILNAYGPTECSDDVTHHVVDAAHLLGESVLIGRPLANTRIYITDDQLRPQPVGLRGELLVGGIGVGRGYRGSPDLTADAFVPSPFPGQVGERLYRSGDSGKWASDGQLEYIGRLDYQLKVRGYRIEPRDIEIVLRQSPDVRDAVVLAREVGDGNLALIAYLLCSRTLPVHDLHEFARARLPMYMLPVAYVLLDDFPRTLNGKIDRRALPEPTSEDRPQSDCYEAPRGATEVALAERWAKLFDLERVGRRDNFLDLGGHSLLATQLVSWIYNELQIKLSIRDVFEAPFVNSLAERIDVLLAAKQVQRAGGKGDEIFF
jgi:amino acid adenylation domain-containing protein